MQLALDLAAEAAGRTCPNPPVGAVIVRDNAIVGRGYHPEAGQPHAEVFALRDAGGKAAGSTLYVTLEPCCHQGRTGPCTEAIIAAGVGSVVVGTLDPNPRVAGNGVQRLQEEGIDVTVGLLEAECRRLIAPFAKHITTGLPYVTLKMAMTLDGQTATSTGDSQWISNEESRRHVHRMRDRSDAIMVGIGTILKDDPRLTTRRPDGGKDPIRIVVDSHLQTPVSAQVLAVDSQSPLLIITSVEHDKLRAKALEAAGAEIIPVSSIEGQGIDLKNMMIKLGERNIQSVLLEGGATLASSALGCGVVDRLSLFIAPKLLSGNDGVSLLAGQGVSLMKEAIQLRDIRTESFSGAIIIEGGII